MGLGLNSLQSSNQQQAGEGRLFISSPRAPTPGTLLLEEPEAGNNCSVSAAHLVLRQTDKQMLHVTERGPKQRPTLFSLGGAVQSGPGRHRQTHVCWSYLRGGGREVELFRCRCADRKDRPCSSCCFYVARLAFVF